MEANTSCLAAVLSRTLETLPADAIVLALLTHAIVNAHKIDYDLVVPHTRRHLFEFRVLVADHNRLGVFEDAVNAIQYYQLWADILHKSLARGSFHYWCHEVTVSRVVAKSRLLEAAGRQEGANNSLRVVICSQTQP